MAILADTDLHDLIEQKNAVYVEDGPELDPELQIGP
jgi:hypothetical protein